MQNWLYCTLYTQTESETLHTHTALARAPQARSRAPLCSAQLSCPVSGLAASARSSMVRGARQAPPDPSGKPAAHEPSATQPADTRVQIASHARRRRDRDTQHVAGLPRTTQHNNTRNASAIADTKYMRHGDSTLWPECPPIRSPYLESCPRPFLSRTRLPTCRAVGDHPKSPRSCCRARASTPTRLR